ncbi:MAG: M81 family metallopeptidase [Burkholderiales bacterium]|nr:M81 family metallopeptidase [Burkholderiales bacterium]
MKFFIAQLATETNTFCTFPTGRGGFEQYGIFHGDASRRDPEQSGALLRMMREMIEADGHAVVESLCAFAQPAGRTVRAVWESMRDEIVADLRAALPVDAVQLMLHGAMVAEGCDDCEGELIAGLREVVGPAVPIGVELDLHCHYTERMRRSADLIICFKEYPHIDAEPRARELYRLLLDTAAGRIRPVTAVVDCRMVGLWHTTREPMRGFVKRMQSFEGRDGVLSVSLGHGFPWGDVADSGARLWVIADGDEPRAQALATQLAREFWDLREATRPPQCGVDAALDRVRDAATGRPVVIGDVADNPGGGAPGDSTFILRRIVERGIEDVAIGAFWDLGAIQICSDAGVGAVIDLRVGGKCNPSSGDPLDLRVTVRAVLDEHGQSAMGGRESLGRCVWVEAAHGVHLLLASLRCQVYGTDAFTGIGITLTDKHAIVVKSTQHFHAQFAPLAAEVLYVSTPGALTLDFAAIDYRVRPLAYWPRVVDPHTPGRGVSGCLGQGPLGPSQPG